MGLVAVGFGTLLILLGLAGFFGPQQGYFGTPGTHPTALIPAYFGIALLILGILACNDSMRKHAMHLAAALGLVGFLIPAAMVVKKLASGQTQHPDALILQSLMAALCAVFVGLCVQSFIAARRRRLASGTESPPPV